MQDLLPAQKEIFSFIHAQARQVFERYGYEEIGLPILESTQLFKRAVGDSTDIVNKEMYSFDDRNGENITLRPEGTASVVRAAQQHGLLFNQVQRLWYHGPMFRYERPQKGRYRQFEQIGVECFGMQGPDIDAEILLMCARLWRALGLDNQIRLELNSLGSATARINYRAALVTYLRRLESELDEDSQRRLDSNPLRILDSKIDTTRALLQGAPLLDAYLDKASKNHFHALCEFLNKAGIDYNINPYIVRGLDYYNRTVFEWVTDSLGAQGTVCAGGRYDGLAAQIGGRDTPGIGFALGIDRLALMLAPVFEHPSRADIYVASIGHNARDVGLGIAEKIRSAFPNLRVLAHCGEGKLKAQLKKADASGASLALVLGEDEIAKQQIGIKSLRLDADQVSVPIAELKTTLNRFFS